MSFKPIELIVLISLALWNIVIATRMETPYPEILVELFALPLTRLVLLLCVLALIAWKNDIAILASLAFICLGSDVIFLTK